jgi:threonine dehydratase
MRTPTYGDVAAAVERLHGHAARTPLLRAQPLGTVHGATLLVKAENLQIGGAFKFRGAYNRLVQLDREQAAAGVVAFSSGNHAQGVAAAGRLLGVPTTIVMPADAPRIKIDNTRGFGAEVIFFDRMTEDREAIARRLVGERGATLVPSYDDPDIIAGQGTTAVELVEQAQAGGHALDVVVVPVGGGGLIAGCSLALRALSPRTSIYGAEPAACDDTRRSLRSGRRESNAKDASTICDALMSPMPGALTFPINRQALQDVVAVSDAMVLEAMAYAWRELKLVVEPGGAVALASVLNGLIDVRGKVVGIIISGGNVDPSLYGKLFAERAPQPTQ